MRVYEGSAAVGGDLRGSVLTVGNFDGLHLGHRALIDCVLETARARGAKSALYTFNPHPRRVLSPDSTPPPLMSWEQLCEELEARGLDAVVRERFTREFAGRSPDSFLRDVLVGRIHPSDILVGRDFHFGRGRSGTGELLARLGPELGLRVEVIGQVRMDGEDVSSTAIREALSAGDVSHASKALGRVYELWGRVTSGDRRGRELGFATANLETPAELIPAHGVYATRVRRLGRRDPADVDWPGVTNVGTRPTFEPGQVLVETHLIDFQGDLYGEPIAVAFLERIRAERRFSGPEELKRQIARDVARAREIHAAFSS